MAAGVEGVAGQDRATIPVTVTAMVSAFRRPRRGRRASSRRPWSARLDSTELARNRAREKIHICLAPKRSIAQPLTRITIPSASTNRSQPTESWTPGRENLAQGTDGYVDDRRVEHDRHHPGEQDHRELDERQVQVSSPGARPAASAAASTRPRRAGRAPAGAWPSEGIRIGSHSRAPSPALPESSRRTEIRQNPRSRILASSPCSAG